MHKEKNKSKIRGGIYMRKRKKIKDYVPDEDGKITVYLPDLLIEYMINTIPAVIVLLIIGNIIDISEVAGNSMNPAIKDGDFIVLFQALKGNLDGLEYDDIIVFDNPYDERSVKRVVGLPGDIISYEGNQIVRNGVLLSDDGLIPYEHRIDGRNPVEVGEGLFILGDNRPFSVDSQDYGVIDPETIVSKVFL